MKLALLLILINTLVTVAMVALEARRTTVLINVHLTLIQALRDLTAAEESHARMTDEALTQIVRSQVRLYDAAWAIDSRLAEMQGR